MSKPKNWPAALPYLTSPLYDKDISASQIQFLHTKPQDSDADQVPTAPSTSPATETPCRRVRIQVITDRSHPAHGQFGLFAAQDVAPGELIVAYLGKLHGRVATREDSDYDIWLDRGMDVAVDAAEGGNEGRFVNDYRGVGGKGRANARFENVFCERWGEVCVGVWAVGGRSKMKGDGEREEEEKKKKKMMMKKRGVEKKLKKKSEGGIKKGEEILVSYGKGFWEERRKDGDGDDDGGESGRQIDDAEENHM